VFVLQVPERSRSSGCSSAPRSKAAQDDTPDAIAQRLELYRRETEPLVDGSARSNVAWCTAERSVNEVFNEIQEASRQAAVA
jgi:adenylate kinase family enzyme